MRVVASNSGCCGIKIIRDFTYGPYSVCYGVSLSDGHDDDENTTEPSPYSNWAIVTGEDLKRVEKASDLLEFYVKQIKERRPSGMIEVNLVSDLVYEEDDYGDIIGDGGFDSDFVDSWRPLLLALGFTEETFINSNSGNRIHHFTCIY